MHEKAQFHQHFINHSHTCIHFPNVILYTQMVIRVLEKVHTQHLEANLVFSFRGYVCQEVSKFLNEIVWPPSCLWVLVFNTCPCKRIFREKNQTHTVIHGFYNGSNFSWHIHITKNIIYTLKATYMPSQNEHHQDNSSYLATDVHVSWQVRIHGFHSWNCLSRNPAGPVVFPRAYPTWSFCDVNHFLWASTYNT